MADITSTNSTLSTNSLFADIIPFAQMQQEKQTQQAIVQSTDPSDTKDVGKDFKGLMPAWMLAEGQAYANEIKFNSDSGQMGQFLQAAAKMAALLHAFTQAVMSLQAFGSLKSWLDAPGTCKQQGELGTLANMLKSEIDNFQTNGKASQVQQEKDGEFNILTQKASGVNSRANAISTTTKSLGAQGENFIGDEGTIGDFIEQISETFTRGS